MIVSSLIGWEFDLSQDLRLQYFRVGGPELPSLLFPFSYKPWTAVKKKMSFGSKKSIFYFELWTDMKKKNVLIFGRELSTESEHLHWLRVRLKSRLRLNYFRLCGAVYGPRHLYNSVYTWFRTQDLQFLEGLVSRFGIGKKFEVRREDVKMWNWCEALAYTHITALTWC